MFFEVTDGGLRKTESMPESTRPIVGLCRLTALAETAAHFGFPPRVAGLAQERYTRYESPEDSAIVMLNLPGVWDDCATSMRVVILLRKNILLFFCEELFMVGSTLKEAMESENAEITYERLLHNFFAEQMDRDSAYLERLELQLSSLENALITDQKQDCVEEIIGLRRRLMALSRYYDEFLNVLDGILENEDSLFEERSLRFFKSLLNRADRISHRLLNLRDYVTQVRESYQAQVDISLNATMKVFTVMTAIFLPLTLIAGWYGMNVQMPEFQWRYGYAFVAALAVAVVAGLIVLLKKKNMF